MENYKFDLEVKGLSQELGFIGEEAIIFWKKVFTV